MILADVISAVVVDFAVDFDVEVALDPVFIVLVILDPVFVPLNRVE